MPSPVTSANFDPGNPLDLCDRFKQKLLNNEKITALLAYLFTDAGRLNAVAGETDNLGYDIVTDLLGTLSPIGETFWSPKENALLDSDVWLQLNGQIVSRTTYARLFGVFGTQFNASDYAGGEANFQLPNLSGRFVCGAGGDLGLTAGTKSGTHEAAEVTLTEENLPNHRHRVGIKDTSGDPETVDGYINNTDAVTGTSGSSLRTGFSTAELAREIVPVSIPAPIPPVFAGVWYVRANWKISGVVM